MSLRLQLMPLTLSKIESWATWALEVLRGRVFSIIRTPTFFAIGQKAVKFLIKKPVYVVSVPLSGVHKCRMATSLEGQVSTYL